jgi:hypothetical protein
VLIITVHWNSILSHFNPMHTYISSPHPSSLEDTLFYFCSCWSSVQQLYSNVSTKTNKTQFLYIGYVLKAENKRLIKLFINKRAHLISYNPALYGACKYRTMKHSKERNGTVTRSSCNIACSYKRVLPVSGAYPCWMMSRYCRAGWINPGYARSAELMRFLTVKCCENCR